MQTVYKNAIVILGPEVEAGLGFSNFITNNIPNTKMIGDGTSDIMDDSFNSVYATGLGEYYTSCDVSQHDRTLVVVTAHGTIYGNGQHIIQLGKESTYYTKNLFADLANTIKNPFDIIITSCHGRAAEKDLDVLPKGTQVAFISSSDESTVSREAFWAVKEFPKDKVFSVKTFFEQMLYEKACMTHPALKTVGDNTDLTPVEFLSSRLTSKILPENIKSYINAKISSFCSTDVKCHTILDKSFADLAKGTDLVRSLTQPQNYTSKFANFLRHSDEYDVFNEDIEENYEGCMKQLDSINRLLVELDLHVKINSEITNFICNIDMEEDDENEDDNSYLETLFKITADVVEKNSDHCMFRGGLDFEGSLFETRLDITIPEFTHPFGIALISSFAQEYCNINGCADL